MPAVGKFARAGTTTRGSGTTTRGGGALLWRVGVGLAVSSRTNIRNRPTFGPSSVGVSRNSSCCSGLKVTATDNLVQKEDLHPLPWLVRYRPWVLR